MSSSSSIRPPVMKQNQPTGIRKKSEFICLPKFNNQLPDIPFDPKYLVFPYPENRFVKYQTTSLEKTCKRPIYTNPTLGININMTDPDVYRSAAFLSELDDVDKTLVKDYGSSSKPHGGVQLKASWLRRTEYFTPQVEQTFGTSFVEEEGKKQKETEELYPEERARKISKSFEPIPKTAFEHPRRKNLKVDKVLPLLPAFGLWMNTNFRAAFQEDPKDFKSRKVPNESVLVSYTITKGKDAKGKDAVETIANLSVPPEPEDDESPVPDEDDEITPYQQSESFTYQMTATEASTQEYVLMLDSKEASYFPINGGLISLKRKRDLSGKKMVKRARKIDQDEAELVDHFDKYLEEEE